MSDGIDVAPGILAALLGNAEYVAALGAHDGAPSIFTKRPIPSDTDSIYPATVIGPPIAIGDRDGLTSRRPIVVRDVTVYGFKDDHYRAVDALGYTLRRLFHREPQSIAVDGAQVVEIVAAGPRIAPVEDQRLAGRVVTLTITLKEK